MIYHNRSTAGRQLASRLTEYSSDKIIVLSLARGGVPLGYEIARKLNAPLDVIVVRKLGSPTQKEYGIGAISEGGVRILDGKAIDLLNVSRSYIETITELEKKELERRVMAYRGLHEFSDIEGKDVIIVDDGLATGVTARAAVEFVKLKNPRKVIYAAPVCVFETAALLEESVDEVVCLSIPSDFEAVGKWYEDYEQVTDEEVVSLLQAARISHTTLS